MPLALARLSWTVPRPRRGIKVENPQDSGWRRPSLHQIQMMEAFTSDFSTII